MRLQWADLNSPLTLLVGVCILAVVLIVIRYGSMIAR